MDHHTPLIAAIVGAIVLAFILGALAQRLKISPLVGYLLAGVCVGPFTPGFVADQGLITELAEIGVILLMFGVGLHFSLKDLLAVKSIAVPGAIGQIAVATLLGWGLSAIMGWPISNGIVFGLALSVASTVVLLRALQERRLIESTEGRIAVGWLIVEDLFMVLTLVLLPPLAGIAASLGTEGSSVSFADVGLTLGITLGKVAAFVAVMLVLGRKAVPWILHYIAHTGSRELFRLAVLAIALGIAFGAAVLFGVSFALGAFFAGMVLSESELSHRAAEETLPLRDAFAVLFFVSVGMLLNPVAMLENFWPLLGAVAIVVLGKSLAAFIIVRAFRYPTRVALVISASLAQIGEFSFILAGLGVALGILTEQAQDLILAAAIVSILLNPPAFVLLDRLRARMNRAAEEGTPAREITPTGLTDHTILVGYGRVGSVIGDALRQAGAAFLVIDTRSKALEALAASGVETMNGNAAEHDLFAATRPEAACCLFVAVPDAFEAGAIVEQARTANAGLPIIARAHSDAEARHLVSLGATSTVIGETELALEMLRRAKLG